VSQAYPDPARRLLITIPLMIAMTMVAVDITIANVALPHMQSSLLASQEQVVWVLTSYLIAGAIATPLSGWLAGRFGRNRILLCSIGGFTIASALCGMSNDLEMMVLSRALQGASGAALIPLSQAVLLDINPPENIAKAMAIFSLGSMAGPIIGPTLGGYLTDAISWRWVFFINLPFGVLSFLGMLIFNFESRDERPRRFDMFGFLALSAALAAFQLGLDRGEHLDWFDSTEIWIYAVVAAVAVYFTFVHLFTARNTFVRPELFKDRNFAIGSLFSILTGIVVFGTIPLIVIMTQTLLGYTAFRTGLIGLPRALGTMAAMIFLPRIIGKVDTRIFLILGLVVSAIGMALYARLDLFADEWSLIVAGFIQGVGGGLMFLPLSVMVFSTLPQHLRNEGAAMYSLTRNLGNAVGISLLQRELIHSSAQSRSHLVEGVRPDSQALQYGMPDFDFGSAEAVAQMNAEIGRQSAMVGNVEIYWLVVLITLAMIPLALFMRGSVRRKGNDPMPIME